MTTGGTINQLSAARRASRTMLNDDGGVAAAEFALTLPVALLFLSLFVYGGQAFFVQRKVTLGAMTVADIFAEANNIIGHHHGRRTQPNPSYPNLILYPYDGSGVQVEVSQLLVATNNGVTTGTVVGSWANANGTPRPIGQQMSVDPSIAASFAGSANSYVVLGEVQYPFQPTGIYYTIGAVSLHDSIMMIPRTAAEITVQ